MTETEIGFYLDLGGGGEVLKEMAAAQIATIAGAVAAEAGPDAEVTQNVTDRARATVRVPADQQAKDGVLSRAAAGAGLEVVQRRRKSRNRKAESADE
jgi:hypothetical protein